MGQTLKEAINRRQKKKEIMKEKMVKYTNNQGMPVSTMMKTMKTHTELAILNKA